VAVALLVTLLTGFESAGIFAEETVESRVKAPRAIISAAAGTGIVTWFFAFAVLLAVPNIATAMKSPETLVPSVLDSAFGSIGSKIFLVGAFIAVSSTAIATLAAIVRTLYAFGRDRLLPGSSYLTRLSKRTDEPIWTIVVATLLCLVPLVAVTKIELIIAAITGLIVLPYVIVLSSLLVRRLRGWPSRPSLFSLGRWGMPLTVISLAWVLFVFVDTAWPRESTNPNWGPLPVIEEFVIALAVIAGIWWLAALRRRSEATVVDPEAEAPAHA
jgi:amino acid transporter